MLRAKVSAVDDTERTPKGWEIIVVEFPNGVRQKPRRCAYCGAPKLRGRSQYWLRWINDTSHLMGVAHVACSPDCVHEIANELKKYEDDPGNAPDDLFREVQEPRRTTYQEFVRKHGGRRS